LGTGKRTGGEKRGGEVAINWQRTTCTAKFRFSFWMGGGGVGDLKEKKRENTLDLGQTEDRAPGTHGFLRRGRGTWGGGGELKTL